MKTPLHTPTPWTVDPDYKVTDADGEFVAYLSSAASRYCDDRPDHEGRANVAFIVTACNVHDDLVAACNRVLRSGHFSIDHANNRTPEACDIRDQLIAALAKVGV